MTTSSPYFSLVIPTLNEEFCIPQLLKDIKLQTFGDYEVIVVDSGSEDKTQVKVKKIMPEALVVSHIRNVSYQRNLGGKKARGIYIIFLDADSRIPPYFLEGIKYRISTTGAQVFTTWLSYDGQNTADKSVIALMNLALEASKLLDIDSAYGAMIGCKREAFKKVAGFKPELHFGEDAEFVQRVIKAGYRFELFHDPKFTFSLRRFKKEGTLTLLQKAAKLNLKSILTGYTPHASFKKEYPMLGGSYYRKKESYPRFIKNIETTLSKLKHLRSRQKLQQLIENLLGG